MLQINIHKKNSYRGGIDKIEYKWMLIGCTLPNSERSKSLTYFPFKNTKGNKNISTNLFLLFLQKLKDRLFQELDFSMNKNQNNVNTTVL